MKDPNFSIGRTKVQKKKKNYKTVKIFDGRL